MNEQERKNIIALVQREVVPAIGCTEPMAVALCVAKAAEVLGRKEGIRVYQFLKEPLIRRFGAEWYDELCRVCDAYLKKSEG